MDEKTTIITTADIEVLRQIEPRKSILNFNREEIAATEKWRTRFFADLKEKSPYFRNENGDWREGEKTNVKITIIKALADDLTIRNDIKNQTVMRGICKNADTGWNISIGRHGLEDSVAHAARHHDRVTPNMLYLIEEIVSNGVYLDSNISERNNNSKSANTIFMHKMYAPVKFKGDSFIAKLTIEETFDGQKGTLKRLYNLQGIKTVPIKAVSFTDKNQPHLKLGFNGTALSISDLFSIVKACDRNFYTNIRQKLPQETINKPPTKPIAKSPPKSAQPHSLKSKFDKAKAQASAQNVQTPKLPNHNKKR